MEVAPTPAPKRLLYVITKSNWGGAQRYVYDLAVAAQQKGHTVRVASGREGELTDRLREAGVSVFPIPSMQRDVNAGDDLSVFFELISLIRHFKPDVVHGNSSKAGALVSLAARLLGVRRIIFTAHGWAFNEQRPRWQKALIALVHYITVGLSHLTICNSEATRCDIAWMPFVKGKLVTIHHGVRPVTFYEKDEARRRLAPHITATTWIGCVAELHTVKGHDTLIQAVEHVLPDYPDTALIFAGEGDERGYLEHLIKVQGVGDNVFLLGHVPEAPHYLKAFDLFVLPSRSESLGYVLLEAGAAELPVVASNIGGIPEVIVDHSTGMLVPPNNPEALTEAILELLTNPSLAQSYAATLHKKVEAEFTLEQMIDATLARYEKNS